MESIGEKNKDFFWPSYVDLMTGLFAIVLVLFVLSFKLFNDKKKEITEEKNKFEVLADQYTRIKKVDEQIQALEQTGTFVYDEKYKRFIVKDFIGKEIFEREEYKIKPEFLLIAIKAGNEIKKLINSFPSNENIKFLILIEGSCAYGEGMNKQGDGTYILSYRRALALHKLWQEKNIFDPTKTEIIVSGSGFFGVGRDPHEENNKRFLIQIIPKINK
ncbi:hypothetical protein EFY79_18485 [Hanamia caeni]|jgi:protein associated with RNAse G/E|uniref:OmpA-like domain-containing protein n=1 Tax=Hanamia caeni TaxID=2294116 RepID=A0A3M9N9H5_9BACT|nr:hypothetical protein [Hanamia caeni]RNI33608.1 hypothetical protein EFY79_18485 [Hanamia caeni]